MEGWQYTQLSGQVAALQARLLTAVLPDTLCVESMEADTSFSLNGGLPSKVGTKRKLDATCHDLSVSDHKRPAPNS